MFSGSDFEITMALLRLLCEKALKANSRLFLAFLLQGTRSLFSWDTLLLSFTMPVTLGLIVHAPW